MLSTNSIVIGILEAIKICYSFQNTHYFESKFTRNGFDKPNRICHLLKRIFKQIDRENASKIDF